MVIRCDGGPTVGWGHVMRCLALAGRLREAGVAVTFATWADSRVVAERIRSEGFATVSTGPGLAREAWLGGEDLSITVSAAKAIGAVAVLVDHYQAGEVYLRGVVEAGLGLAVIDDVADRDLSAAGWLLNQNPRAGQLRYRLAPDCRRCLGPEFALLRPQFNATRAQLTRSFADADNRVLVTLGGGDMASKSAAIIRALNKVDRTLAVRCVMGGSDPSGAVERAVSESRHEATVVTEVSDMAREMALSDVSVNGGGSTCWELCCLGTPMVTVSLSGDQSDNVSELGRMGVAVDLGVWRDESTPDRVADAVAGLLADRERRAEMSARGQTLVDGDGAQRAARSLVDAFALEGARR